MGTFYTAGPIVVYVTVSVMTVVVIGLHGVSGEVKIAVCSCLCVTRFYVDSFEST